MIVVEIPETGGPLISCQEAISGDLYRAVAPGYSYNGHLYIKVAGFDMGMINVTEGLKSWNSSKERIYQRVPKGKRIILEQA